MAGLHDDMLIAHLVHGIGKGGAAAGGVLIVIAAVEHFHDRLAAPDELLYNTAGLVIAGPKNLRLVVELLEQFRRFLKQAWDYGGCRTGSILACNGSIGRVPSNKKSGGKFFPPPVAQRALAQTCNYYIGISQKIKYNCFVSIAFSRKTVYNRYENITSG